MKNIIILYHNNCPDGFGAAWAAWRKFKNKASYIGVQHREPFPKGLKNKKAYLLDFCYPLAEMKKLKKIVASLVVIDHHISVGSAIEIADDYLYSVNHSGCALSWEYFHPNKPIPKLLLHIEDTDLWKFNESFTKELMAVLELLGFQFPLWNKIAADIENSKKKKEYVDKGKLLLEYQERIIKRLVNRADKVRFDGYAVLAINSPVFPSEIGHLLTKKTPPFGIVWHQDKNKNTFHLRSNDSIDVAKIAKKYGGGGHKSAAGFCLDIKKGLPWKRLTK